MDVYNYNPITLEYTGKSIADESPLETGKYLIPAFATEIPIPDTKENEVAVFDTEAKSWAIIHDYRHIKLWDKATAIPVIAELGETPADINATLVKPMVDYPKWNEINSSWCTDEVAQLSAQTTTAISEIQRLLSVANDKIAPLQDAMDMGIAIGAETTLLTAWKTYRVLVNRVTSQSGFPTNIDWPSMPE